MNQYISTMMDVSHKFYSNRKVLEDITVAQAIVESNLGDGYPSSLFLEAYNPFGIEAGNSWKGRRIAMPANQVINGVLTPVVQEFRRYDNFDMAFQDHNEIILKPQYRKVINATSIEEAAQGLLDGGWATDPMYAANLIAAYEAYIL